MTQELHYTSLPRGLRPGSRGFCTVASTPSMPVTLTERLESLSGYQPVYPPGDPSEPKNPLVFAHFRLTINQRPLSVLSRIGPAGLDYSGRPNKFAHHLVLDPTERADAGPAWLLALPELMQTHWTGEPRELPIGRPVPRGDNPPRIAQAWRNLTGDAGWAGTLAESFLDDPKRPAFLVFQPGMNLLPLFTEALALLPPARRWDVDFTTYLTQLPQGVTCAWRGVVDGSPEATHARRLPSALIIDLTQRLEPATGGPLVHLARTGERLEPFPTAAPTTGHPTKTLPAPPPTSPHTLTTSRSTTHKPAPSPSPDFALIPELAARVKPRRSSKAFDPSARAQPRARNQALVWGSAIASLVALIGAVAVLGIKFAAREDAEIKQVLAQREKRNADADKEKAEQQRAAGLLKAEQERSIASTTPKKPVTDETPVKPIPPTISPTTKAPPKEDPQPKHPISIAFIVPDVFELDDPLSGLRDFTQKPLIIKPEDPPITELKLLGLGNDLSYETTKILSGQRVTVFSAKTSSAAEELATFELIDGRRVEFHWNRNVTPLTKRDQRRTLKDCVLETKRESTPARYYLLRKKPEKPKTKHEHEKRVERKIEHSGNSSWKYVWDPDPQLYSESTFRRKISIENLKLPLLNGKDVVLERGDDGEVWTAKWHNYPLVTFTRVKGAINAEIMDSEPNTLRTRIDEKNQLRAKLIGKKQRTIKEPTYSKQEQDEEITKLDAEIKKLDTHIETLERVLLVYHSDPEASITFECEGLKFEVAKILPQPKPQLK